MHADIRATWISWIAFCGYAALCAMLWVGK
jgi:hypothetical protein